MAWIKGKEQIKGEGGCEPVEGEPGAFMCHFELSTGSREVAKVILDKQTHQITKEVTQVKVEKEGDAPLVTQGLKDVIKHHFDKGGA